jgi:hypothetical protein
MGTNHVSGGKHISLLRGGVPPTPQKRIVQIDSEIAKKDCFRIKGTQTLQKLLMIIAKGNINLRPETGFFTISSDFVELDHQKRL